LISATEYWALANSDREQQIQRLAAIANTLTQALRISIDGRQLSSQLLSWELEAVSLAAISNPITPQMASLSFRLESFPISPNSVLELQIDEAIDIPWPALLRVDSAALDLPVSRLLTDNDRSSRPVFLASQGQTSDSSTLASMAMSFQKLVPGISWAVIGYQHIIPFGLDHIVFVLGLFFLSTQLSTLFYQVSCFTVAHSLTLGLATLGIVSVPAAIVEPLIAASIMFIALDNLYSEHLARYRLVVVTLFGLLHGLGFASALSELIVPAENFFSSLLLFNLGVELGQLTVLVLAFLAVGWLRSWTEYSNRVARPATVTIAGVGAYWLVKRVAF
jgi:hypothetical protein